MKTHTEPAVELTPPRVVYQVDRDDRLPRAERVLCRESQSAIVDMLAKSRSVKFMPAELAELKSRLRARLEPELLVT